MAEDCSDSLWNIIHWIRIQDNALPCSIRKIWRKNYGPSKTRMGHRCLWSTILWFRSILWRADSGLVIKKNPKKLIFLTKNCHF